jgi:dTDP-glucose 4,6-dehydratase
MNLLITGAAGFIGSHFLELILKEHRNDVSKIVVVDIFSYSGLKSNIERARFFGDFHFIQEDISNAISMSKIFRDHEIDNCINFAAESHVDRSILSSSSFVRTNVLGTDSLIENFKNFSKGRFLQVSTDEVYGSILNGSWNENSPLNPNSPYSASKASADLLVRSYVQTHQINAIVTRSSNNFGIRQFPEKFIPLAITNVIEGKKIPIYGSGENVRDWIHVADNCRALWRIFSEGQEGRVYNIGANNEISNLQLAQRILKLMNLEEDMIEFVADRKGHDFRYSVDDSTLRTELGFVNSESFDLGLSQVIDWYSANIGWWKSLKVK